MRTIAVISILLVTACTAPFGHRSTHRPRSPTAAGIGGALVAVGGVMLLASSVDLGCQDEYDCEDSGNDNGAEWSVVTMGLGALLLVVGMADDPAPEPIAVMMWNPQPPPPPPPVANPCGSPC